MGSKNTGNQRFISFAYNYIRVNGASSCRDILNHIYEHQSTDLFIDNRKAVGLLASNPLFTKADKVWVSSETGRYQIQRYNIVPENIVVQRLVESLSHGKSMISRLNHYPKFIQDKVNEQLHSPNNIINAEPKYRPQPFN